MSENIMDWLNGQHFIENFHKKDLDNSSICDLNLFDDADNFVDALEDPDIFLNPAFEFDSLPSPSLFGQTDKDASELCFPEPHHPSSSGTRSSNSESDGSSIESTVYSPIASMLVQESRDIISDPDSASVCTYPEQNFIQLAVDSLQECPNAPESEVTSVTNEVISHHDLVAVGDSPAVKSSPQMGLEQKVSKSATRSIYLPIVIKKVNGIKTVQIINKTPQTAVVAANSSNVASNSMGILEKAKEFMNSLGIRKIAPQPISSASDDSQESLQLSDKADSPVEMDSKPAKMLKLELTDEEKRMMKKEGIVLPNCLPLTRQEENQLQQIRRKIRNKKSAQISRKRKKEYIDGLEERVKNCTDENITLQKRVRFLESQNQTLFSQLKRIQTVMSTSSGKNVQSSTCLAVLLLSIALVLVPNLNPLTNPESDFEDISEADISQQMMQKDQMKLPPVGGRSRALLSKPFLEELAELQIDIAKKSANPEATITEIIDGMDDGKPFAKIPKLSNAPMGSFIYKDGVWVKDSDNKTNLLKIGSELEAKVADMDSKMANFIVDGNKLATLESGIKNRTTRQAIIIPKHRNC